jgi:hypothetical protein
VLTAAQVYNMLKENIPSFLHFIDERTIRSPEWQVTLFSYFEGKVCRASRPVRG